MLMKKMIVFDLDGVLIDSKKNMQVSWNQVNQTLKFKQKFSNYFKNIGLPFEEILKKIGIKRDIVKAKKIFRDASNKNLNLVNLFPFVKQTVETLKKRGFELAVITSKERSRTLKILKRFKLKFEYILCPTQGYKGKPHPFLINDLIKRTKKKKEDTYYIGDTYIDYKFAKNSGVNFIYCKYGYGKISLKTVKKINKIRDLLSIFNKL